jgi:hypothetical protein
VSSSEVGAVRFEVADVLIQPRLDQAWEMYATAFADLRAMALQRHVMYRDEFDQVMTDRRIEKHLAVEPRTEAIVGLATFTNVLDADPLISLEFFAHRWPDLYKQGRIWYLGFFAVDQAYRGSGIFESVIAQMWAPIKASGGMAVLDICAYNAAMGLPQAITRTLRDLSGDMVAAEVDAQTYWAFSLGVTG